MRTPLVVITNPFDDEGPWRLVNQIIRLFEAAIDVITLGSINLFLGSRFVEWRMRKIFSDITSQG